LQAGETLVEISSKRDKPIQPQTVLAYLANCAGMSRVLANSAGMSRVLANCAGMSRVLANCAGMSRVLANCAGMSRVLENCTGMSRVIGIPGKLCRYVKGSWSRAADGLSYAQVCDCEAREVWG
jgi:hypothetical protein